VHKKVIKVLTPVIVIVYLNKKVLNLLLRFLLTHIFLKKLDSKKSIASCNFNLMKILKFVFAFLILSYAVKAQPTQKPPLH